MTSLNKTLLVLSLGLSLVACGGGSDGSSGANTSNVNNTTTPVPKDESTGSVTEKLDVSKTYRIIYDFPNSEGSAKITEVKQNDKGIVTEFGDYKLSSNIIGKEIAGNKNYALARISKGEITYTADGKIETTEVSKYANGSYYYFAFSPLTQKLSSPTPKTVNCTDVNATQARLLNGSSRELFVSPTAHNGNIVLNADGTVGLAFTIKVGNDETTFKSSMLWSEKFSNYNSYNLLGIANQVGQFNQIGTYAVADNGPNSVVVGAIYNTKLGNGTSYQGAISMVCNF